MKIELINAEKEIQRQTKKALIIAVGDYLYKDQLPDLPGCTKSAYNLLKVLKSRNYDCFDLIGNVSYCEARERIYDFFNHGKRNDFLLFYYLGHGLFDDDENYLSTSDTNADEPDTKGISLNELIKKMNNSESEKVVSVLDCCYGGNIRLFEQTKRLSEQTKILRKARKALNGVPDTISGKMKCILSASRLYQEATHYLKGTLFTMCFINGLMGGHKGSSTDIYGDVTVSTLHRHIGGTMNDWKERLTEMIKQRRTQDIRLSQLLDQDPQILSLGGGIGGRIILDSHPEYNRPVTPNDLLETLKEVQSIKEVDNGKVEEFNRYKLRYNEGNNPTLSFPNEVVDLHEKDLRGINLSWSILSNAILSNAKLSYSLLQRSVFSHANLSYAELSGADLFFSHFEYANLCHAKLHMSNLKNNYMISAKILDTDLSCTCLSYADVRKTILFQVDLTSANLEHADFSDALIINPKGWDELMCEDAKFANAVVNDRDFLDYLRDHKVANPPRLITSKTRLKDRIGDYHLEPLQREYIEKMLGSK